MGLVYATLTVRNGDDVRDAERGRLPASEIRSLDVEMLVDSVAYTLALNERIAAQLGIEARDQTVAELADGSVVPIPVAGPVELRFATRRSLVQAAILPGDAEPLLGAIPMEDLDVVIDPQARALVVNPKRPLKKGGPFK
jgi:hypothetical protein